MKKGLILGKAALALFCAALTFTACEAPDDDKIPTGKDNTSGTNANINPSTIADYLRLEFPHVKNDGNSFVIVHKTDAYGVNYSIEWDPTMRAQRWSCYEMYNGNSATNTSRYYGDPQYPNDADMDSNFYFSDPYWSSGYEHGHICPSADRLCSAAANKQTFYLTNMQPQIHEFNAYDDNGVSYIWNTMENKVRSLNKSSFRDILYVCKGGTIDNGNIIKYIPSSTATNRIPVPKYFFVALLCEKDGQFKALGLWFEHKSNSDTNLKNYAVSIDRLEQLTGIDFFCNLSDDIENKVEATVDVSAWNLN
jgi:endonuclease G